MSRNLGVLLFVVFSLGFAACSPSRRAGEPGDPNVRVSRYKGANALTFLFGSYQTFESGADRVSGCRQSLITPSSDEFRDPQTREVVLADEVRIEGGTNAEGACLRFKTYVFRGRGTWTQTRDGDHYEFTGSLLRDGSPVDFQSALSISQVNGPYLLRIKVEAASFLISRRVL